VGETMKHKIRRMGLIAALATGLLDVSGSWASRIVGSIVTGRISALRGDQVVLDGRTYQVKSGSHAGEKKRRLVVGELVDIVLDSGANVVDINEHATQ
jgi:alpha-acetolactate decarboxylase